MPYTLTNPPSFAKNKTKEEIKIAVEAANAILEKGASEEDAIFGAIAQVKAYNKKQSQKKALEIPKRSVPSHVSAVLKKVTETPVEDSTQTNKKPIAREFLGKNALPSNEERNLVSVELKDDLQLYHTFDTGEQIITDLKKLQGTIENYVSISQSGGSGGNASLNSKSLIVNTFADVPLIVNHNMELLDPEALIISAYLNGKLVDLDCQILDGNSVEILTYVNTVDLRLNFLGI